MTQFGIRGERLMASLIESDHTLAHEKNPQREVAISACLAADRVDRLEEAATEVEAWVTSPNGTLATHPVLIEVRQQANLLARLVASLRIPDATTGKRPQTRPLRGVHAPAAVSSLDRARIKAEGA